MRYCKKCVTPDTRPRIEFDEEGVCNACRFAEKKEKIDWEAREKEFRKIMDEYRAADPMKYDCVIPASGGKDSTYVAYMMKHEYKMNPLAVTFAPDMYTEEGQKNAENFKKIGIDHILFTPNKEVMKKLARKMFVMFGDPFIPWVQGVYSIPARIARNFNIPLIIYGEMGESEYGGSTDRDDTGKLDGEEVTRYIRPGDAGKDWKLPENWVDLFDEGEISKADLKPYIYPSPEEMKGIKSIYYGFYHKWDGYENYKFVKEKIGFYEVEGRSEGTYTNYTSIDDKIDPLYIYMMLPKYGISRAAKDASPDIRDGRLTREEAVKLIEEYGSEFPYQYLKECLEYLDMDEEELFKVIDSFRNKDLWENVAGKWRLKNPIWET